MHTTVVVTPEHFCNSQQDLGIRTAFDMGTKELSLYCPFWMVNKTGLDLTYKVRILSCTTVWITVAAACTSQLYILRYVVLI